jgi:riboflavin synthase alpha subunit
VNLIPHTLAATTFADLRPGRRVNLEMDVLVKAARGAGAVGQDSKPALTIDRLLAKGFGRKRPSRRG